MRHTVPRRVILFLSGLVVIGVGAAGLLAPEAFHEANGITVGADVRPAWASHRSSALLRGGKSPLCTLRASTSWLIRGPPRFLPDVAA
ncbi:hypothetical protein [Micromonospora sp. CPCC 206061]|uniref:hypothetical protein n=1 Tax=Micromonospora sp. CPCC 206061 TaxID=3122410 RepID=UPI002FF344F8